MKFKRNYLTSDEMGFIVSNMIEREDALEREILKVGLVAQFLVEEESLKDIESCNQAYDLIYENGIDLEKEVANYKVIDKILDNDTGVVALIKGFVEKIDLNAENLDLSKSIETLQNLKSELQNEETLK